MTETNASDPEQADRIVRRHGGLLGRTALVSALTLVSRVLGFVREVVMAALFGEASAVSDAFFTAWRVPNLFRRLFGEGALSTALQTNLTEEDHDRGLEAGRQLFARTIRLTTGLLVVVTAVAMLAAWLAPDQLPFTDFAWFGSDPAPVRDLIVRLMPFVLLVCLAALCGGALHVRGHYAAPNVAPAVLNVIWIVVLLAIGWRFGWERAQSGEFERQWSMARWLAWGVLAGGVVQLGVLLPALASNGLFLRTPGAARGAGADRGAAWRVLRTSLPLALGAAVYQVNVMIDGLMAEGLLADGGPSALYYANRVQQFPLALVAIATTSAVFPSLKAFGHLRRLEDVRSLHDRSQLAIAFLALPATAGLFALAQPIAATLFQHGNYGAQGVARVAAALSILALALLPAGAVGLAGRTYYALGDFRTPVRVSVVMLVANVLLNVLFVMVLEMDTEGLALATVLSSWVQMAWLLPGLKRLGLPLTTIDVRRRLLPILAAAVACGLAAWLTYHGLAGLLATDQLFDPGDPLDSGPGASGGNAVALAGAIVAGAVTHLLASKFLRVAELREVTRRFSRRGRPE